MTESSPPTAPVTFELLGFDQLGDQELTAWHRLRAANPQLDSPYFHPGFAAAVHRAREVQVVVGRDLAGEVRMLLPCHRQGGLLQPAGWPAADFQGPIRAPGTSLEPLRMLPRGVRGYAFDHLLETSEDFAPFTAFVEGRRASPFLDVSGGLQGYLGRASPSGKDNIGQARRRLARAERELGPVSFAADIVDQDALEAVIALKRGQYAATGAADYFADPARVDLMRRLLHTRDPDFAGILSTVRVGDKLLAAHFGLRAGPVLHWWFPVYDPELARFAPGWILLRELISAAPALGIARIDLGRGEDEYKRRAKTGDSWVCQGLLTGNSAHRVLRRAGRRLVAAVRSVPVAAQLRRLARRIRS